jgi:hypothetical protein
VVAKREVLIPDAGRGVILGDEALLRALPQVQAFAAELPRLATPPRVDIRGDRVFVVFSVFETGLTPRQIVI